MNENLSLLPINTEEEQVIDLWLKQKQSPHTRRMYRKHIDDYKHFIGKLALETTLMDLQRYREYLEEKSLRRNSQKIALAAIKSYLSFAYKTGFSRANVGAAFGQIKAEETMSERILTEYEVQTMILSEKNQRNAVLLRVIYAGGMRVSELCGLRWKNIIVHENGQIKVSVLGKGESKRHILLNAETSSAILSLSREEDTDFVFKNEAYHSKNLTQRSVQYIVKKAAKNAGIKRWRDVSPHWLRHSHATHAIDRHAPLSLVKETLGHKSIATTDIYVHINPNDSSSRYLPKF